jgi:hypothetical protein
MIHFFMFAEINRLPQEIDPTKPSYLDFTLGPKQASVFRSMIHPLKQIEPDVGLETPRRSIFQESRLHLGDP